MIRRLTDAPARSEKTGRREGHGDHPLDRYLKDGRIPHIWCPGCGIGIAFTAFVKALQKGEFDTKRTVVVSGIGCSGRAAGYLNLDTYHTTHGRAIPFATGLKLANPKLKVVVFSGDGDLFAIGGNHIIHAARRNVDLTVICINNFNYGMTGGQGGPTTPIEARTTTTPYGCAENPFNLIYLAQAAGATYVARWTALHTYEMRDCMIEGMQKRGFSFIEIIVPCPTGYGRRNRLGSDLDLMRYYRDNSYLADELDPEKTALPFDSRIAVGKFVDIEKPTFMHMYQGQVVRRARGRVARGETDRAQIMGAETGAKERVKAERVKAEKRQVRLAGFGGQGIVLAGLILGKAVALFEGSNAVMTQSYGPEARGGACSADVVISSSRINYPRVTLPDVLALMSEEAARTYGSKTAKNAILLINEDLVKTIAPRAGTEVFRVPATGIAESLGRVIVANIVMLGFLTATTGVVGCESMKKAILASIPKGTEELNLAAFRAGYDHGLSVAGEKEKII